MHKSIYLTEYQQLTDVLRAFRLQAGMTQIEVAEKLDVPQSFVSKYESGERRLDLIEVRVIAGVLGRSLCDVVREIEHTDQR